MRKLFAVALMLAALPAHAMSLDGTQPKCVVGGCSSQLCTDAALGEAASTCEWVESYACYKQYGVCEAQADGTCGWTPTAELLKCLDTPTPLNGSLAK